MTLGRAPDQGEIFNMASAFCDGKLSPTSIYRYLHENCHRLFADDSFSELFKDIGRRSVPPRIVAVVTVTMVHSAIRGLLREAPEALEEQLRSLLKRDDDYSTAGKPSCDWDDGEAREALVDALTCDAKALLDGVEGQKLGENIGKAATLLATVVGQDIEEGDGGTFRIARRVAKDRVISTVDPEARHGHKSSARGFDGYKGHISIDPDSEIITATKVTPGNVGDGAVAQDLLGISQDEEAQTTQDPQTNSHNEEPSTSTTKDRSSDVSTTRRATWANARQQTHRPRLLTARRRGQPQADGDTRHTGSAARLCLTQDPRADPAACDSLRSKLDVDPNPCERRHLA